MVSNWLSISFVMLFWCSTVAAQRNENQATDLAIANRFLSILERSPQRGTALEKVLAHHLQSGTLDGFVNGLKERTNANANDGVAWMILGLIESQRRMDMEAIAAFTQAEKLRPEDAFPAYYRGQSLLRIGEPNLAIEAFETAFQRSPPRMVLLEICEQLGRLHQRQNNSAQAIEVWKRLESLFPGDLRVLESIASIQNQEGNYVDALPRYEQLIIAAKDPFQRTQYRIEAAQLRIRLGAIAKGTEELETILKDLKPDGWLYSDVQRKMEEAFLKIGDQAGLILYYENRIVKFPEDIESIKRLCKYLLLSGRTSDAIQWMSGAIERAPTRIDLRKIQIEQLISCQRWNAVIEQYEKAWTLDPNNSDIIRDWGKSVLRDPTVSLDEAKIRASAIWKKGLEHRSAEALAHIQVAELFQSAQMPDEARELYERAIELAPEESQFREYFGSFLFQQSKREEAFTVWDGIANGPRRNANNIMRLAEIYDHVQLYERACDLAIEACKLAPENPTYLIRTAAYQRKAEKVDACLESLSAAEKFADGDDQRESILVEKIKILEASNRLKPTIQLLQSELRTEKNPRFSQWYVLARYLAYEKRWMEANAAVHDGLLLDQHSLSMLILSAEVSEGLGSFEESIHSLRTIADLDRRKRQDCLERIAKLRAKQLKWPEAIEVAKEVVQTAPSRIEGYEFLASICNQAKKPDLGIEALKKAMQIDPDASRLTTALGNALTENKNHDEAIELYWRALMKSSMLEEKVDLALKLVTVFDKRHRLIPTLDRKREAAGELIDRLESGRKNPANRRDLTVCLAQVYQSQSDFVNAKRVLSELQVENSRDTILLRHVARISLAAGDLEAAITYQRELVAIAPGKENETYLASLLRQRGDWFEANEIVVRLLQNEPDLRLAVQDLNGLLHQGEFELVLKSVGPLLRIEPNNWELLFRLGLAHVGVEQWAEAQMAFERVLALSVSEAGIATQNANQSSNHFLDAATDTLKMIDRPELLEIALGGQRSTGEAAQFGMGMKDLPESYGAVRIASIAWLVCCESKNETIKSHWIQRAVAQADRSPARFQLIDALAIAKFRQDSAEQISLASKLAEGDATEFKAYFLELVRRRQVSGIAVENKKHMPLTLLQLELMLKAFEVTKENAFALPSKSKPNPSPIAILSNLQSAAMASPTGSITANFSGQWVTITNGRTILANATPQSLAGNSVISNFGLNAPSSSFALKDAGFVRTVVNELRFAGQAKRAESFLEQQSLFAELEIQLASLCEYLLSCERFHEIERPWLRWFELQPRRIQGNNPFASGSVAATQPAPILETPDAFLIRFLESWGEQASADSSLRCLDAALAVSNLHFATRELSPIEPHVLSRNASVSAAFPTAPIQYPSSIQVWCTSFISVEEQRLLQASKRVFSGPDSANQWIAYLESRTARADFATKPLEQLRLALSLAERNGGESVRTIVVDAMKQIGKVPVLAIHAALALLDHRDFKESHDLAKSILPENPRDAILRELILLFAAKAMNDKPSIEDSLRALENHQLDSMTRQSIAAVQKQLSLRGTRVPNNMQQQFVPQQISMQQLQLMTSSLNTQATSATRGSLTSQRTMVPTSSNSNSQLAARFQQMLDFEKKGNAKESIKTAKQIIGKPRVYAQHNTDANFRTEALKLLAKYGEIEGLIAETERRIKSWPNSFALLEQLAEYYEATGNTELASQVILRALETRPNANAMRIYFANQLAKAEKTSRACDHILELVRRDPQSSLSNFFEYSSWFDSCSRSSDLREAIFKANFYLIPHPESCLLVGKEIIDSPDGFEIGATVLEKLVETNPSLRQPAIHAAYGSRVKFYPRFLQFSIGTFIPNENDAAQDRWYGLRDDPVLQTNELLFEKMLDFHRKRDIVEELEPSIREAVVRLPNWLAGRLMLAIIAERTGRREEAREHFAWIASSKRIHEGVPEIVAWKLVNQLKEVPEARLAAAALSETLLGSIRFSNVAFEQRPVIVLAKLLIADGQRSKAIEFLTREYETGIFAAMSNIRYQAFVDGTPGGRSEPVKVPMLADQMLSLGMPVESFQLFELNHSTAHQINLEQLSQRKGLLTSREDGQRAAIRHLESLSAEKAIFELLQDRSNPVRNQPALELMFHAPLARNVLDQSMESELQKTLIRHAKDGKELEIEKDLQRIAVLHPKDITVFATQARIRLSTGVGDSETALDATERAILNQVGAREKFASLDGAASSSEELRKIAETIATTWLVARECYKADRFIEVADRLAEHAYQSALFLDAYNRSRTETYFGAQLNASNAAQVSSIREAELANILLFEWGQVQIRQRKIDVGLAKFRELLDATIDASPKRKTGLTGIRKKTWTLYQFEWMMRVANASIDLKQIQFAKQVARDMTTCHLPIDPNAMRKSPVDSARLYTSESAPGHVIQAVYSMLQRMEDDQEKGALGYDLFLPLILPNEQDVALCTDGARPLHLLHEMPQCYAEKLVAFAIHANRLRDLESLLESREPSLQKLVLQTYVAIAENDYVTSKELLGKIDQQLRSTKLSEDVTAASQVAIPAFRIAELREASLPILNALIAEVKRTSQTAESEFQLFPLVREVDAYLKNRREPISQSPN